jgi:hypothetical protein
LKRILFSLLLLFTTALILIPSGQVQAATAEKTSIANPFIVYTTLDELKSAAGFAVKSPKLLPTNYQESYHAMLNTGKMIEVFYKKDAEEIIYRMAPREDGSDISGDYTQYPKQKTLLCNDLKITTKGTNHSIRLAIWHDAENTYSLSFSEGISADMLTAIIQNIN